MALIDTGFWNRHGFVNVAPLGHLPRGSMVSLPGRGELFVTDTGMPAGKPHAPTLFLAHALACTGMLTWYAALPILSRNFRCIVPDQRWHGQGIRSEVFALEDCADDIVALADVLGIDKFIVGGYSMGGMVAQLTWKRHQDRVLGLILCSTAATFRQTPVERVTLDALTRGLTTINLGPGSHPLVQCESEKAANRWAFSQFRQTSASAISSVAGSIVNFNSIEWLHTIDVPTAVVVTVKDRVLPVHRQNRIVAEVPGASTYEVNAGHAACAMSAPEWVPAVTAAAANVAAAVLSAAQPALASTEH